MKRRTWACVRSPGQVENIIHGEEALSAFEPFGGHNSAYREALSPERVVRDGDLVLSARPRNTVLAGYITSALAHNGDQRL